jgi:hypothetical protein
MIIYTPLDIPKIEPNNWDEWWDVWNNHARPMVKVRHNHNYFHEIPALRGFDLYRKHDMFKKLHAYQAPLAPQVPVVIDLIEQVKKYCVFEPLLIRVAENLIPTSPHSDYSVSGKYEFRSILWNTYTTPVWKFTYENETRDMILPHDTNSFYYLDYPVKHSTIYDGQYSKGLVKVYGTLKSTTSDLISKSTAKYKDLAWII